MINRIIGHHFVLPSDHSVYSVDAIVYHGVTLLGLLCRRIGDPTRIYRLVNPLNFTTDEGPFNKLVADIIDGRDEQIVELNSLLYNTNCQREFDNIPTGVLSKEYLSAVNPVRFRLPSFLLVAVTRAIGVTIPVKDILKPKVIDYPAYKVGTIVYYLTSSGRIEEKYGAGKIVELLNKKSLSEYKYGVEFIDAGYYETYHRNLLPTIDYFDHCAKGRDCYVAQFDCGVLFNKGEKFVLYGEYLHNKNGNVILRYSKFQDKFKENAAIQVPADKADKI